MQVGYESGCIIDQRPIGASPQHHNKHLEIATYDLKKATATMFVT
jgi:hypothetical protein